MNNKSILITGGAGFIGSRLAIHIQNNYINNTVVILDKFNNGEKLSNGNDKFLGSYKNLEGFKGIIIADDVRNEECLKNLAKYNFDVIFHLAAISDTRADNENEVLDINLNSFMGIINLAMTSKAKLVYASSGATYGSKLSRLQKIGNEKPDNIYGFSKYMMDIQTLRIIEKNELAIIGLRYFNVYGFGEENKLKTSSTILQFTNQFINSGGPKLFEDSKNIYRDFIYINDVIEFTVKAAEIPCSGIYNIGTGIARSFYEVATIIKDELKSLNEIKYIPNPYSSGYQSYTKADIEKTLMDFDYSPKYTLEEGIKDYMYQLQLYERK